MPQSLSKVYVHIVFSTKYRQKFIDDRIAEPLFEYIGSTCRRLKCNPVQVGGHEDHVHILCLLARTVTQSDLLEEIKKDSSKWMKKQGEAYEHFYWQNGFGIFSVNPSEIDVVVSYIKNQKVHHTRRTFKQELRAFFKKYEVAYDERYVWE